MIASSRLGTIASALLLLACGSESRDENAETNSASLLESERPHIILVLIDTLRSDHTTVYGYGRDTTPHLARIAANGTVMEQHFANAPWTKPSVASIITGLHPSGHGSRIGQFDPPKDGKEPIVESLSDKHATFIEGLRDLGYRTLAHISNYNLLAKWGYSQGYQTYAHVRRNRSIPGQGVIESDREAIEFAIRALDEADAPTFVWSHMMSVHQYASPKDCRVFEPDGETPIDPNARHVKRVVRFGTVEEAVAAYDASILYSDQLVGELYDAIQERHPNTILIVTSDHGEEFYEHGGFEHRSTLYNELIKVPFVITGPDIPKGHRVSGITDSIDIYPTILSLAGFDPAELDRPGQILVSGGKATTGKSETFAEQHHRGPFVRFALNRGGNKLIRTHLKHRDAEWTERTGRPFRYEFYEGATGVEGEPASLRDDRNKKGRQGEETEEVAAMVASLNERIDLTLNAAEKFFGIIVGNVEFQSVTEDDFAALRAIGYAGSD